MKNKKIYSSKEEFENSHPYVLVQFEIHDNRTFSTIDKSFSTKKQGEKYLENHGMYNAFNFDLMTRKKYDREVYICS
jgi:hypothetical protein